jgi:hypothetical protein
MCGKIEAAWPDLIGPSIRRQDAMLDGPGQAPVMTPARQLRQPALAKGVLSAHDFFGGLRGGLKFITVMKNGQNLKGSAHELVKLPSLFLGLLPEPLKFFFHGKVEFRIDLGLIWKYIFTY